MSRMAEQGGQSAARRLTRAFPLPLREGVRGRGLFRWAGACFLGAAVLAKTQSAQFGFTHPPAPSRQGRGSQVAAAIACVPGHSPPTAAGGCPG
jgi:hypothetical protein